MSVAYRQWQKQCFPVCWRACMIQNMRIVWMVLLICIAEAHFKWPLIKNKPLWVFLVCRHNIIIIMPSQRYLLNLTGRHCKFVLGTYRIHYTYIYNTTMPHISHWLFCPLFGLTASLTTSIKSQFRQKSQYMGKNTRVPGREQLSPRTLKVVTNTDAEDEKKA